MGGVNKLLFVQKCIEIRVRNMKGRQLEMSNGMERPTVGIEQDSARVRSAFNTEHFAGKDEFSNYNL